MHFSTVASLPMIAGAKLLLAATSPLQNFIDQPGITHEFCNCQALKILRGDGFATCADFLEQHLTELNAGVYWADKGWKNVSHYFEPVSGKGLWRFTTAVEEFQGYFLQATASVHNKNYSESVFFLGAAVHLLQDMCVPHHARAKLFAGHQEYEGWVQQNYDCYAAHSKGMYNAGLQPHVWLLNNAVVAADLFDWVNTENSVANYDKVTHILLPLAQRSTAGLFQQFFIAAMGGTYVTTFQSRVAFTVA